jgi:hypothetical protein
VMPRRRLEGLTSMAMNSEDKKAGAGAVTIRQLSPTLRYEGLLFRGDGRNHRRVHRRARRRPADGRGT